MTRNRTVLAALAAAALVGLGACGEEDEVDTPGDVQQQIDEAQDQVDEAQEQGEQLLEDPVGEGSEEAQEQLNEELQGEGD